VSAAGEAAGVGLLLMLAGAGAVSGLVPVVNAEALLTAATAASPDLWLGITASLTVGQCAAKVLIYLTARDGPQRLRSDGRVGRLLTRVRGRGRARARTGRRGAGGAASAMARLRPQRLTRLLAQPLSGTSVVLVSATLGLPPLAAVSVLAGTARLRLPLFVAACLTGRLARFAVIAWPVAHLVG
jgi:membrane protein YqaA with SNARE-associated domain